MRRKIELRRYVGRNVTVNYVDDGRRESIDGELNEVVPGSNIVMSYREEVPQELRSLPIFKGRKSMEAKKEIPFSGSSAWISSIFSSSGRRIYSRR